MEGDRLQYNNKALVGNWYEDRLDQSHAPIPELERTGKYRITPLKMIETTPDTYLSHTHDIHRSIQQVPEVQEPKFINKTNLHLTQQPRPLPETLPASGFGAALPKHVKGHNHHYLHTTSHSTYGGVYADSPEKRLDRTLPLDPAVPAGKDLNKSSSGGIRCGGATDERLHLAGADPKRHTFIQRTWWNADLHSLETQYCRDRKNNTVNGGNIDGLCLKGLGEGKGNPLPHEVRRKNNGTIRRDQGIWAE